MTKKKQVSSTTLDFSSYMNLSVAEDKLHVIIYFLFYIFDKVFDNVFWSIIFSGWKYIICILENDSYQAEPVQSWPQTLRGEGVVCMGGVRQPTHHLTKNDIKSRRQLLLKLW